MTVQDIARICHEANRAYCESIMDFSQPYWLSAPDWQKESAVAGVQAILEGKVIAPQESHESWYKHKLAEGWVYGPVKVPEKKEHPCMVPFDQLSPAQQAKDRLFFAIVTALIPSLL